MKIERLAPTIISAKEASNKSVHYHNKFGPGRCGTIFTMITLEADNGGNTLELTEALTDDEVTHLTTAGFTVEVRSSVSIKRLLGFITRKTSSSGTVITW